MTRLAILIAGAIMVTSGIAMAASSRSGGAGALTNRDAVYDGASISGTVTDSQGQAITTQDICVQADIPTQYGWQYSGSTVTNDHGEYTITNLPSGSYKVAFADCDQTYQYDYDPYGSSTRNDVPQYYNGTTEWEAASLVVLSEDGAKTGIDAQMQPATSISGHVYASTGNAQPRQGECVAAIQPNLNEPPEWITGPLEQTGYSYYDVETAADGSYTLEHLKPSAEYGVEFYDCTSPKTYLTQFNGGVATPQQSNALTPTLADPITGIDAHLTPGAKLSGLVTDSSNTPIGEDVCVNAGRNYEGSADEYPYDDYGYSSTNPAGEYFLSGLAPGSYTVRFEDCGGSFSSRNDVSEYYGNQPSYGAATPVAVTLSHEQTGIDAKLPPATSISGHVYGSLGTTKPLDDICVYADTAAESTLYPVEFEYANSELGGEYTVKHLVPGTGYKLEFINCDNTNYTSEYYNGVTELTAALVLTPTLAEPISDIDAHLTNNSPETEITGGPANGAASSATSAAFAFSSAIAVTTFECQLDAGSFAPCTSPFSTGPLSDGKHTFTVRGSANGISETKPPSVTWTVAPASPNSTSQGSVPAGGTVSSNPGATPTASEPVVAEATLPDAGTVTMTKEPASTPSDNGYTVFGQQLDIAATQPESTTPLQGTVANPITLTFQIDGSSIPAGTELASITVLRNGVAAADCTGAAGTASPDPCVETRAPIAAGGVKLTVLTTHCSLWNFATTSSGPASKGATESTTTTGTGTGSSQTSTTTASTTTASAGSAGVLGEHSTHGAAKLGHVKVSGSTASVPVQCAGSGGCSVKLSLVVQETIKGGKLTAVAASKPKGAKTKEVTLATATVTLAAGASKILKLTLGSAGKQLLASRHTLKVALKLSQSGVAASSSVSATTLTFKAKTNGHKA